MADRDGIEIIAVEASPPQPRGTVSLDTGEQPRWIDLALTVRNRSDSADYYVIASVRRMHYDASSQTLSLDLSEPYIDEPESRFTWQFVTPDFLAVPPGTTAVITVSVPEVANWITAPAPTETGVEVETVELSGLQRVRYKLAYSDSAFEPEPEGTPEALMRALATWGETLEATLPVRKKASNGRGA